MWRQGVRCVSSSPLLHRKKNHLPLLNKLCRNSLSTTNERVSSELSLEEVKKILTDVKADDIRVIPTTDIHRCNCWTDFMVFVTGRSAWHVRNISQALLFQAKQKQRGAERMLLPSVEGEKEGKWIVIDSGTIVIHALDEKARAYYNLERLWEREISTEDQSEDLRKAFVKVRRKNNSKKPQVAHKEA